MYWRIRKITPDQIAKSYGVYVVCVVSVLFNIIMMTRLAPSKALNAQQKNDFTVFAKQVTQHLTDSNFLTYEQSMNALVFGGNKSELQANAKALLQKEEVVPKDQTSMRALARQYKDKKAVACISIDDVQVQDPDAGKSNLVPVEVSGKLVQHSAEGVIGPSFFRFRYYIGTAAQASDPTQTWPVVVEFQDKSAQGPAPVAQGGPI